MVDNTILARLCLYVIGISDLHFYQSSIILYYFIGMENILHSNWLILCGFCILLPAGGWLGRKHWPFNIQDQPSSQGRLLGVLSSRFTGLLLPWNDCHFPGFKFCLWISSFDQCMDISEVMQLTIYCNWCHMVNLLLDSTIIYYTSVTVNAYGPLVFFFYRLNWNL